MAYHLSACSQAEVGKTFSRITLAEGRRFRVGRLGRATRRAGRLSQCLIAGQTQRNGRESGQGVGTSVNSHTSRCHRLHRITIPGKSETPSALSNDSSNARHQPNRTCTMSGASLVRWTSSALGSREVVLAAIENPQHRP
jgi:hypothetical protein